MRVFGSSMQAPNNPSVATAIQTAPDAVLLATMRGVVAAAAMEHIEQNFDWAANHEKHDLLFLDMVTANSVDDIRTHYYSLQSHSASPGLLAAVRDSDLRSKTIGLFYIGDVDRNEPKSFSVRVVREFSDPRGTFGHLEVNGREYMKTLENSETLIPEGEYEADMRYQSGAGHVLDGDFLVEFRGTPGGKHNVQIHIGNAPSQSQGCILVGTDIGTVQVKSGNTISNVRGVLHSALALGRLRTLFYGLPDPATANPNSCPLTSIRIGVAKASSFHHVADPPPTPEPQTAENRRERDHDGEHDHESIAERRRDERTNCKEGESQSRRDAEMREFDNIDHSHQTELRAGESKVEKADTEHSIDISPPD